MKDPTHFELLRSRAIQYNVVTVFDELINQYPQFEYWSGSHNENLHHYGDGGLVRHTSEIIELGVSIIPLLNVCGKVNGLEFYLAALFHDTGKMYDYRRVANMHNDKFSYKPSEHKQLIHHLPRSVLIWQEIIMKFPNIYGGYFEPVVHDILAHHGSREFGSPVSPKTRNAWLLHLCDSMSARMDDADTHYVVHKK